MTTINPDVLAQLEASDLAHGSHGSTFDGQACSMEWVALLADEGMTDAPQCASPVLARYTIRLNDQWDHEKRQLLKPYLPRMVGTGNDGKDALREQIASEWLTGRLLGPWLDLAGMGDHMASIEGKTGAGLQSALYAIRDAAQDKRRTSREELKAKIKAHLVERGKPAVDVAAVVAAAAAATATVAADVDAAVAADAAAAVDVAVDVADSWARYDAAYTAATKYYREHPLPVMDAISNLAAKQAPLALELLDALIVAEVSA